MGSKPPQNWLKEKRSNEISHLYEFGPFRLDPSRRVLLRGEESVPLTPKAFETLLLLVENRDKALLKDELMRRLWPESFVEESNLTQTIFVLRKTLGETAQDQRYIVTVRGTGYRFEEKVREVGQDKNGDVPANGEVSLGETDALAVRPPVATLTPVQEAPIRRGSLARRWTSAIAAFLIGVVIAGLGFYWRFRPFRAITESDTILLGDFENNTGDPIFDGTLRQAVGIELEQSPYLKILSDQQVNATLKRMNRQPGARLTRDLAAEVCQRESVKAVIAGSIVSLGNRYLLSLEALDCRNGNVLASEQTRSKNREGILDALSDLSSSIRVKLGESLSSIKKFDQPLREVTTPSLEALKAFTSGAQMIREERDEAAAAELFRRAIELDPDFAMAYSYLAIAEDHLGEVEKAATDQNKAYALRDRVSNRERFLITTSYHWLVTGDVDKELETLEQWKEEYPRDFFPPNSLGDDYAYYLGQYEKSIEYLKLASQLEPKQPYSPMALADSYLALNQVQEARKLVDQALAAGYDVMSVHYLLLETAVTRADDATLEAQRRWSAGQRATDNLAGALASVAVQRGQWREARAIADHQIEELRASGYVESAAEEASRIAVMGAQLGQIDEARRYARLSQALFRGRSNLTRVALALALAGDALAAQKIMDGLVLQHPSDTIVRRIYAPLVMTLRQTQEHLADPTLSELGPTRRYESGSVWGFSILYVRGLAHLKNLQPEEAADAFRRIVEHRGIYPTAPEWALAHLGLAYAYSLQSAATQSETGALPAHGDPSTDAPAKARVAYQDFFRLWKDADPDLLILKRAKEEYAKLHLAQTAAANH